MPFHLAELASYCDPDVEISQSLNNLKPHIDNFAREAHAILRGVWDQDKVTMIPYIARGLLESSFTAVLFRLDPFRALTLARFQSHVDFDHNRPNSISVDWTKDILSEVDSEKDIWQPKQKADQISRALLSPYQDHVTWQPALQSARDYLTNAGHQAPSTSRLTMEPSAFISSIRGESRQLYSFWSKGIHCEFFAMEPVVLDEVTCTEKLRRTVDVIADLCFISHFALTAVGNIDKARCSQLYGSIKETLYAE